MEANSDTYYPTYTEYKVVSRKNRKKKRKERTKQFTPPDELQSESEVSVTVESTANSNPTDDSGELESDDPNTNDATSPRVFMEDIPNSPRDYVSRDASMSVPPSITENSEKEYKLAGEDFRISDNTFRKTSLVDDKVIEDAVEECGRDLLLNTRALSKEASTYELEKFEKKALIIFNQENVDGFEKRHGTQQDVDKLVDTFQRFGFEVTEHKDLTKDRIIEELDAFTSPHNNLTDFGCVAVAILTHGSSEGLLRAKDQQFSEVEVINKFKVLTNESLVTKPKIIIIQACRGTKILPGAAVFHVGKIRKDLDDTVQPYILPVESDMLVLHSSYAGSPSHRNELHGSWFIQELCNKINALAATHDLESIMTEVKREVAINKYHEEYNRRTFEVDINKQMPVVTSTLIRKLYLKRFGEESPKVESFADGLSRNDSSEATSTIAVDRDATPLLVQYGPCSCFLDHFNYMRSCLTYFVDENPYDETASIFLEVANTFEDGVEFNTSKEKMCKAIAKHLRNNAQGHQYFKYLYFSKHE